MQRNASIAAFFAVLLNGMGPLGADDSKPVAAPKVVPGIPPGTNPNNPAAAAAAAGKDETSGEKTPEKPAPPKTVKRIDELDQDSDPSELDITPDDDGRVEFQFRNQPWVDLVGWLAEISDQPLDWLELPADRVNLRSPGRYTVDQTKDLFNRYLLARGFTLLENDTGLTVAKTEGINPAIVPRVDPESLGAMMPHRYVRVLLDVEWLDPEKLSTELKAMVSANGRLTPLTTTRRLEVMDAAINARQIAELLRQERDQISRQSLAPEFKLRHLSAAEAKRMLEQFLGIEKKDTPVLTPQQIQRMQQRGQPIPVMPKKKEISIVANARQNSVLIRAPADRVAVAIEFLKRIDVPGDSMTRLSDVRSRVEVFRLAQLDPEQLVSIVVDMNVLEPGTQMRVDEDNNALIVAGSAADRYIISSLIERLDGSGRNFEVLQLRRLSATEVAESISFLMGKEEDDDSNDRRRNYFYGYYGNNDDKKKSDDEFRVAANAKYRQILLWANEQEMNEVRNLLVKLGELPPPGGNRQTFRVIDAAATPETLDYLRRLKEHWKTISPNALELPAADRFVDPNETDDDADESKATPADDSITTRRHDRDWTLVQSRADDVPPTPFPSIESGRDFDRAFAHPSPASDAPASDSSATGAAAATATGRRPPIRIEVDLDGNLVISSSDTAALDRLESLMLRVEPPRRPYRVFRIEHASASWMQLNLEDYFTDNDDEDDDSDFFSRLWYGFDPSEDADDGPAGLGKDNTMKMVSDLDTNTIVVSGATPGQLKTIGELIELWDVPEPVNKRKTRFTRLVQLRDGRAEQVAETVKEAYRDLLSGNDKTFTNRRGGRGGGRGDDDGVVKSRDGNGSGLRSSDTGRDAGGSSFTFKGKLSLGIDPVGNTILVSAEGEPLLDLVIDMIGRLDEAARPRSNVEVLQLKATMASETMKQALEAFGEKTSMPAARPRRVGN